MAARDAIADLEGLAGIMDLDSLADQVVDAFNKLPVEGVPGHVHSVEEVYARGELERATGIFHYLCIFEGNDARFWTALAVALQKQKDWERAIDAWSMAALLDATNVRLYLHATECLMITRQWRRAKQCLDAFFTVRKNLRGDKGGSGMQRLVDKAEMWQDVVKSKLADSPATS